MKRILSTETSRLVANALIVVCTASLVAGCGERRVRMEVDAGQEDAAAADAGMGECADPPIGMARPEAVACSACRPPGPGDIMAGDCGQDEDCGDGDNGRCVLDRRGVGFCSYDECFDDGDCDTGQLCACDAGSGGGNICVEAGCSVDADCEEGLTCAPSHSSCGPMFPIAGFYCHVADDSCSLDSECAPGYCAYSPELSRWACGTAECP